MQILSIVQWHHFAYMIISVAMLGFGAAGTVLSLSRTWLLKHSEIMVPVLMMVSGLSMSFVVGWSQSSFTRFDSYLVFADYRQAGKLLLTYLLFFTPFFFGALAIGILFVQYVASISKIYFADLFGSGMGGLFALVLTWIYLPQQLPAIISILPIIAGIIILPGRSKSRALIIILSFLVILWQLAHPPQLIPSQYKDISKTLLLPEAKVTIQKSSPYGFVQTVTSPVLRYAPGLSLTAQNTARVKAAAFVNGDWFGPITSWKKEDSSFILDYTTSALPYVMRKRNKVLVLRTSTGIDVAHAVSHDVESITTTEPNSVVLSLLKKELALASDSLLYQPKVMSQRMEPRTFLMMDTARYDLIVLPMTGTFGGSSGLYALQEQAIMTREAFQEMWLRLNENGVISITSWMDYPLRNPLKVLATMVEVLYNSGIKNPRAHLAAIRSWGTITFVLTKSPVTVTEVANIRKFCDDMMFDPAILPGLKAEERSSYNQLQDERFFRYIDQILSENRKAFYDEYDFNIKPATDNKPFFSQFLRWENLNRLSHFFGTRSIPFFEVGYFLVLVTLVQIAIVSFVLILLPLFKLGWSGKNKFSILLYFSGIGLGYMFVEIVLIQHFILYFGNPVYAASAVLTSLLIFSGLGSNVSARFIGSKKDSYLLFVLIALLLLIDAFVLMPLLQNTIHVSLPIKLVIVLLLMGPLAFLMGMPFPSGLSLVSKSNPEAIPWAWGVNGCISVISTALATILSIELGFNWVLFLAALAYCLPVIGLSWF
ncbi:hypothetical protein [Paraflavisolibacter caeni]|nr:hypothetical protein [Paraflavisolibacter caeni]